MIGYPMADGSDTAMDAMVKEEVSGPVGLREMTAVFAKIGVLSFGGPAGQIGLMHRILVDEKRWISEERFLHALNYCMLLPGPEAQQLATYIGWLMHGTRGGIIAGLLFVIPGLAVIIGLSTAYSLYQDTTWLTGLFYGLKAAVLAIVVEAVIRLGRKTLKSRFLVAIAALAFISLFFFSLPFPLVVLLAGIAGFVSVRPGGSRPTGAAAPIDLPKRPPALKAVATLVFWVAVWQLPLLALWLVSGTEALSAMFTFFSKMALVTFGGAYAVLAYVAQVAVQDYGWLRPGEMLDGLALAETTPGPLVLVLSFVGFLVGFREAAGLGAVTGGVIGALLVAWATFVPSFIWIFAGAPFIERLRGNATFSAALSAITAAVVGVILNLAIWFGMHVLFREVGEIPLWPAAGLHVSWPVWTSLDLAAFLLFLLSAVLLFRIRVGMVPVLAICALAGLALKLPALL
ncbi:chromate transporter [Neorhizobium sp. R1-B]|nr:chromate transporter [Neorhizobium sp. R1-B]